MENHNRRLSTRRRPLLWAVVVFSIVGIGIGIYWGLHRNAFGECASPLERIVFVDALVPNSFQFYIAIAQGYFKQEGVDLVLEQYPTEKAAIQAVVGKKAHLAASAETPIMFSLMSGATISILATMAESEKSTVILTKKGRHVRAPADLKKKKIAIVKGTNSEFFLESFLLFHRIPRKKIDAIDMKPDEMLSALVNGKVDALSVWSPFRLKLQEALGKEAIVFSGEGMYKAMWKLVAGEQFIAERHENVPKILRALLKADDLLKEDPDKGREVASAYLKIDINRLDLTTYTYKIKLDQSLLLNLEDQALWAMEHNLTPATEVPDFLDHVYSEGLKAVNPKAVNLEGSCCYF